MSAAAFHKPAASSSQDSLIDKRKSLNEFALPTTPKCVRKRGACAASSRLAPLFSSDDEDDYSAAFRSKTSKARKKAKLTSSSTEGSSSTRPPRLPTRAEPASPELQGLLAECR